MFLFLGETPPQPRVAGDIDGSGVVDVSDAIYLLTYLFLGGPPPPPLFSKEDPVAPPQ